MVIMDIVVFIDNVMIIDIMVNMDIIPQRLLISWGRNCGDNGFPDDYGYTQTW